MQLLEGGNVAQGCEENSDVCAKATVPVLMGTRVSSLSQKSGASGHFETQKLAVDVRLILLAVCCFFNLRRSQQVLGESFLQDVFLINTYQPLYTV